MENLKYDSLYKFMVSLGVILIFATILVNSYIFYNNEIVLVSTEEISMLTETSSEIIKIKQNIIYNIINNYSIVVIVSIVIATFGITLLILGFKLWYKNVQKIEDEKRKLENNKLLKEIDKMSYEEKQNKVSTEVKEADKNITINEYLRVENEIVDIIKEIFAGYEVLRDVKVGKSESIDCLIPYDNPKNLLAKAFEIKYVKNTKIASGYLNRIEESMEKISEKYYGDFSQFCYVSTLLIVDNSDKFIIHNKSMINKIKEYNSILHNNSQICKIYIADKNNIKEKLKQIRDGRNVEF